MRKILALAAPPAPLDEVPAVVRLLPLGLVKSRSGDFTVDEESVQSILAEFKARRLDLPIDYEHQTLKDVQAPAGGWIKELFVQDGALCARVEWTPPGAKYLQNKEYRYLSPVVLVRKQDNKAVALHSAALTNTPAIDGMYPIANALQIADINDEEDDEMDELLSKLAQLLGLSEGATEEQVLEALAQLQAAAQANKDAADKQVANKTVCGLLGLQPGAKTEDVTAAIMALKAPSPEADELRALKARLEQREADEAVERALKAGKVSPAMRDWAVQYALKDPAGFAAFADKAPAVVPMDPLELEPKLNKAGLPADEAMAVCKMLGLAEDDVKQYGEVK